MAIESACPVRQTVGVPPPTTARGPVDDALVACVDGDPASFGPVYDALAPVAYGTSLGVLRDPDHAAEVTQEVMVEVWQTAARFDPARASARTWVATLARRRAVDRVRSEQSRRDRDQRDLDTSVAGAQRDVVAEDVERRMAVRASRAPPSGAASTPSPPCSGRPSSRRTTAAGRTGRWPTSSVRPSPP